MPTVKPLLIPPIEKCNCLLFDFDGTLAPNLDLPDMRRQVIDMCETHEIPRNIYSDLYIVEIIDAATTYLKKNNLKLADGFYDSAHDLIKNIELAEASKTKPFEGVKDFLVLLRQNSIELAVVTRNCREAVLKVFPELLEYVDCLFARDDTAYLKPDTRHLEAALKQTNKNPAESAIIGDGALDMITGKKLGVAAIGVLTGNTNSEALYSAGADLVVSKCQDIIASH